MKQHAVAGCSSLRVLVEQSVSSSADMRHSMPESSVPGSCPGGEAALYPLGRPLECTIALADVTESMNAIPLL